MNKNIDLRNDPIKKSFYRYLLPAVLAMIIKSIHVVVDAMFVGVGVGAEGLGAISLTVPFFSIFSAIALGVGIGGAAMMSMQLGKGDQKEAQGIFSQSMWLIFMIIIFLVAITFINLGNIVSLMGASGTLAVYSKQYLGVMLPFFVFSGLWGVLSCFVRNDTNPSLVMQAIMASAIVNVILDYIFIFIFNWGVKGAALATGLSQLLTFVILLTHFNSSKGILKLSFANTEFKDINKIISTGLPTFFIESALAVSVIVFNYVLLTNYTQLHVSAYGIVMNVGFVGMFLLMGIGQACQPIISFNHGAKRVDRVKEILRLGFRYGVGTAMILLVILMIGSSNIAGLFTTNNVALIELTSKAMKIYFVSMPFMAINAIAATVFQSTEQAKIATVISLSRGFVLLLIALVVLPVIFPDNGIWGTIVFSESLTAIYSLSMLVGYTQKLNKYNKVGLNTAAL